MNTLTLNKVLLNARPLNMRRRVVKDKDFIYKVLDREFTFSKTAGGKSIKSSNARIEAIKGNSVVWNQLSTTAELNQSYKTESLPIGASVIQGHKYAMIYDSVDARLYFYTNIDGANQIIVSAQDGKSRIFTSNYSATSTGSTNTGLWWYILNSNSATTYSAKNIRLIDLTKAFPNDWQNINTIEDYYARKPIVEDEYAYNEGEVIHMDVQSIESVGVNQWDEEWELGNINPSGLIDSDSRICSKNFTRVIPNETYYFYGKYSYGIYFYDANKNYVTTLYVNNNTLQIPSNAMYFKFNFPTGYGTTYKGDYCINISDTSINGKYFPHVKRMQSLDIIRKYFPNGMHGIGAVRDSVTPKKATQRIGVKKMKDLNWKYYTESGLGNTMFRVTLEGIKRPTTDNERVQGVIVSRYYPTQGSLNAGRLQNKCWLHMNDEIFLKDDSFADAASFVASLTDDDVIIYELATPIETEIDPQLNMNYKVWDFGTEQAIANVPSTPLKADIGYHILKNNLELTLNS